MNQWMNEMNEWNECTSDTNVTVIYATSGNNRFWRSEKAVLDPQACKSH